jgi:hypothetical protein
VALELAHDRGNRVAHERAGLQVVAIDGVDQPHGGHLPEVVHRLAGVAVAPSQAMGEGEMALDEFVARGLVAVRGQLEEPLVVVPAVTHPCPCSV